MVLKLSTYLYVLILYKDRKKSTTRSIEINNGKLIRRTVFQYRWIQFLVGKGKETRLDSDSICQTSELCNDMVYK